jgi:hypothetical protein
MPRRDVSEFLRLANQCELEASRARDPDAKRFFCDLAIRFLRTAETFDYFPEPPHQPVTKACRYCG